MIRLRRAATINKNVLQQCCRPNLAMNRPTDHVVLWLLYQTDRWSVASKLCRTPKSILNGSNKLHLFARNVDGKAESSNLSQVAERLSQWPIANRATKRSSDRAIERPSNRAIERPSNRAIERTSDRAIERSSDRGSSDQAIEESSDRAIDGARKSSSRSPSDTLTGALCSIFQN